MRVTLESCGWGLRRRRILDGLQGHPFVSPIHPDHGGLGLSEGAPSLGSGEDDSIHVGDFAAHLPLMDTSHGPSFEDCRPYVDSLTVIKPSSRKRSKSASISGAGSRSGAIVRASSCAISGAAWAWKAARSSDNVGSSHRRRLR